MALLMPVSTADFETEILDSPVPVVVDFSAEWCGPCRVLAPVLERVAKLYSNKALFRKADIDDNPELAEYYRIVTIPTLLMFRHGRLLERHEGQIDLAELLAKIDRLASIPSPPGDQSHDR